MKLSAAYNFFDGGELLLRSIEQIRDSVDHISVVYQWTSNYGNEASDLSRNAIQELRRRRLVEDLVLYEPNPALGGGVNEHRKRGYGIELARRASADHFLFMDSDEFYLPDEFSAARAAIDTMGWDYTTVGCRNYYRNPRWRLHLDPLPVPFICRLSDQTEHVLSGHYRQEVDPTRRARIPNGRHHFFPSDQILMHHMTGLRWDLEEKLANSSQNDDAGAILLRREQFEILPYLRPGSNVLLDGSVVLIEEVDDLFGLSDLFPQ